MEEYTGKVILNYDDYGGIDLYSDGDVEEELLEIVKKHPANKFNEIIAKRNSWPIFYHLSHIRANIIEWMNFSKEQTVLEIGSGCGAITGTLADKLQKVTCIELSKRRSLINAHRNKDKDNIEIKVGNFQDIEKKINEKYDYITLIGVFEYAESYIKISNPYVELLNNIKKHLKDNGKIVIAIENRFGLKYWAGCKEDHLGKYYEGIEGYTNTNGIKTFTKNELEELLKKAGLNNTEFYYPYPDYKFPINIYSDYRLPKKGELNNNFRNFDMDRLVTFDESKVFDSIISNELFSLYSNSYLVIAQKEGN